ncbi:MAG: glycosyl hydrolase family 28-related protein [Fusobacteriaceae bacterium]
MTKKILTLDNIPVIKKNIGRIDTIEKLKASTIYSLGDVVEVLGYYTKGDGAHHYRQYDPTYTGEDSVEGWKLVLGQQSTLGNYLLPSNEVNVKWFGARGNGITDDTESFKKAFNINGVNNGYKIKIPNGQYIISEVVCNKPGTIIEGEGSYSTILKIKGGGVGFKFQPLFGGNPWSNSCYGNLIMRDIMFYADDDITRTQGTGTLLIDSFNAKFENVRWFGFNRCTDHSGCHFITYDTCYWAGMKFIKHPNYPDLDIAQMDYIDNYQGVSICGNETIFGSEIVKGCSHLKVTNCWFSYCSPDFKNISQCLMDSCDIEPSNKTFIIGDYNKFINVRFERMDLFVVSDPSKRYPWIHITGDNNSFDSCWIHYTGLNNQTESNPVFIVDGKDNIFENVDFCFQYGSMKNKSKRTVVNTLINERIISTYGYNYDINLTDFNYGFSDLKIGNGFFVRCNDNLIEHNLIKLENLNQPLIQNFEKQSNDIDFKVTNVVTFSNRIVYNYGSTAGQYEGIVVCLAKVTNTTNHNITVSFLTSVSQKQERTTLYPGETKYISGFGINKGSVALNPTLTFDDVLVDDIIRIEDVNILCDKKSVYTKNKYSYFVNLDTPYYTAKMQQQGIYDDYIAYRDELHEYKNSLATDETMLLPVLQEPVVPDSIKVFAEKYKLI